MEQQKRKMSKVGAVWEKKDGSGFFIKLGNESKTSKYNLSVEVTVRDGEGHVVAQQKDGFLTLIDPRQNEKANHQALEKVPNLRFEILVPNVE